MKTTKQIFSKMRATKSFLEYSKKILSNCTFDKQLFWKEYQKAKRYLTPPELNELNQWVIKKVPAELF